MISNKLILKQDLLHYCYRYSYQNGDYFCQVSKYFKDRLLSKNSKSVYLPFYIYTYRKFRFDIC